MPALFRLRILLGGDTELRPQTGPAHGWFLRLIADADPRWAEELHPSSSESNDSHRKERKPPQDLRPFSLSPLYWSYFDSLDDEDFWPLGDRSLLGARDALPEEVTQYALDRQAKWRGETPVYRLYSGQMLALRLALFRDEDIERFAELLGDEPALPRLGGAPCRLFRAALHDVPDDPDWRRVSYDALADAPPADQLLLHFVTPTDFSSYHRDLTECTPADLLAGWSASFVHHAPPDLPLRKRIEQGAFEFRGLRFADGVPPLQAKTLLLKDGRVSKVGYEGSLVLEWTNPATEEERSAAHALVAWANFCGTGKRTTLGMGQTRGGEPV